MFPATLRKIGGVAQKHDKELKASMWHPVFLDPKPMEGLSHSLVPDTTGHPRGPVSMPQQIRAKYDLRWMPPWIGHVWGCPKDARSPSQHLGLFVMFHRPFVSSFCGVSVCIVLLGQCWWGAAAMRVCTWSAVVFRWVVLVKWH